MGGTMVTATIGVRVQSVMMVIVVSGRIAAGFRLRALATESEAGVVRSPEAAATAKVEARSSKFASTGSLVSAKMQGVRSAMRRKRNAIGFFQKCGRQRADSAISATARTASSSIEAACADCGSKPPIFSDESVGMKGAAE